MTDPLLSLEDVEAGYGLTQVLRGTTFTVQRGSVVALVGRNGVGKTTTVRSIIGNVTPTAGRIRFDGDDVTQLGPESTVRKGIAIVPEGRRVFPGLTVRENLAMGQLGADTADGSGFDIEDVFDAFENLRRQEDVRASVLSGGERQMLAIGRALLAAPDLLLLDEPSEGLAPSLVRGVERTIRDLQERGLTVLIVEQNLRVAFEVADYVLVMDEGRIVHEGPTEDVRDDERLLEDRLGVSRVE